MNLNKVFLIGRISNEPKVSTTSSGISYCRATIAVNRRQTNDAVTDFIPIVAWRNNADFMSKYLSKGSLVSIEGSFTTSRSQDANNVIRNFYEVTVDNIQSLESRAVREQRQQNSGQFNPEVSQKTNQQKSPSSKPQFGGFEKDTQTQTMHNFSMLDDDDLEE